MCTTPLVAAQKQGCVGPFSSFANVFLDFIFTADFGIVGKLKQTPFLTRFSFLCLELFVNEKSDNDCDCYQAIDAILLLCTAVVLKDRKERERYRLIDAKNGFLGI